MTTAVYAGSFDPLTLGHLDLILDAYSTFEHVIVAVGANATKKPLFSQEERVGLIQDALPKRLTARSQITLGLVEVLPFDADGLLSCP